MQPESIYRDYGFVVFTLPNPEPGNWSFDTFYHGSGSCNVTAGAIDPDLLLKVDIESSHGVVSAGDVERLNARVVYDSEPIADAAVSALVEAPAVSTAEALARYEKELPATPLPMETEPDDPHANLYRLQALRRRLLPYVDILPRYTASAQVSKLDYGEHEIRVHTRVPGEYTVRLEVNGVHPNGSEFMRTKRITVSAR